MNKIHHPSALRNREPIACALQEHVFEKFKIYHSSSWPALEIGSGTGAHAELFAKKFPKLVWQPTEYVEGVASVERGVTVKKLDTLREVLGKLSNVKNPLGLDASTPFESWPEPIQQQGGKFTIVFVCNVFHISSWKVATGILAGSSKALRSGGVLVVYGPFKVDGKFTSDGNQAFDEQLRSQNKEW
eukprot:CAMPEP_0204893336 /NCGR_PEP_ID=MMETSP1349-20130617/31280_1 /ASSEMBLY_ACC=CAM_ASM_000710 /TAXON_ID=215587 /ORGANISM="Aplanochytrium stocchinoi, Strain GSBS06" /LENGTH=186 /DNA_ID=CAMNT_0052059885 /DNA_START=67 /DNA_END=624 /DNA_ORIENTATION=+